MIQHLKEKSPGKTRILVAPLDWGLGHATRCIPIIRELLSRGCEVWLAGEGAQEHLLKEEFPQTFVPRNWMDTASGIQGRQLDWY
jgi:hypothetical protein